MVLVSRARVFRPSTSLSSGSSDCIMDIFSASDVSSTVIFFVQPVDLLQLDLPLLQLLLRLRLRLLLFLFLFGEFIDEVRHLLVALEENLVLL